jgi:hypothetical protein
MGTFTITSDDTLTLYDRVISDLADDDVSNISFPNDNVKVKTGKNRNTLYAKDETGNNANLVLRLTRGSSDDQFLQAKIAESEADFVATQLANGSFVKRLGDGQGNVVLDNYTLLGGVIVRRVDGKENVSGDTVQAVSIYNMVFATAERSIQ